MSGHAGPWALLCGLLAARPWRRSPDGSRSFQLRYRPSCLPSSMTAGERAAWAEMVDSAFRLTMLDILAAGVAEAGSDFWTVVGSPTSEDDADLSAVGGESAA